eukprot:15466304-Alexandrium_andersonii.AAC.1
MNSGWPKSFGVPCSDDGADLRAARVDALGDVGSAPGNADGIARLAAFDARSCSAVGAVVAAAPAARADLREWPAVMARRFEGSRCRGAPWKRKRA